MRLIVGLGNPGDRYRGTRHNAGYRVVASFAERSGIELDEERYEGRFGTGHVGAHEVALLLPETFMNASGEAVSQAMNGLALDDPAAQLLVVIDDLDLSLGRLRLRPDGRDGGQKGLRDIQERLDGAPIPRLRFGIDRPPVGVDPVDWVLRPFGPEDEKVLRKAVPRAADACRCWLDEGTRTAMDRFNGPFPEPSAGD